MLGTSNPNGAHVPDLVAAAAPQLCFHDGCGLVELINMAGLGLHVDAPREPLQSRAPHALTHQLLVNLKEEVHMYMCTYKYQLVHLAGTTDECIPLLSDSSRI